MAWVERFKRWNALENENLSRRLLLCLIATFLFGLTAHAYGLFGGFYNSDSLTVVTSHDDDAWQVSIGRFLIPAYRATFQAGFTMPWLSGVLALFFLSVALCLMTRIASINSKVLVIGICAVFSTNITMTLLVATYVNWIDPQMLALLLAVLAVFMWQRWRWGFVSGVVVGGVSMGLYQADVAVTVGLVAIASIISLARGETLRAAAVSIAKGIVMVAASALLYSLGLSFSETLSGVTLESSSYNSIASVGDYSQVEILPLLANTYKGVFKFFGIENVYNTQVSIVCNVLLVVCALPGIVSMFFGCRTIPTRIVFVAILALLPLLLNCVFFVSKGMIHYLMIESYFLIYVLMCFAVQQLPHGRRLRKEQMLTTGTCLQIIAGLLCVIVAFQGILYANVMYEKRDLEQRSTLALMTRIVDRMEETEGYIPGETPVAFVRAGGTYNFDNPIKGFEEYSAWIGTTNSRAVTYFPETFEAYFDYILNEPINLVTAEEKNNIAEMPETQEAPVFPRDGSVFYVDDVLVVKFH